MRGSKEGIGLIVALMILALLSLLVAAMLTALSVEVRIADNYRTETQLVYLTEAGIEDGREALRPVPPIPSPVPFIKDKPLRDTTGRDAGSYSVTLVRANPLTLRSSGAIGAARKTIEVRLKKSGFPRLQDALTLNEDGPVPAGTDPQLDSPQGLERIVEGIRRHATDVYTPAAGGTVSLAAVGSPADYRVVVVDGDCDFGNASGYGILLVRGELTVYGVFSWNGLILAIGQGAMHGAGTTAARISGAVFLTRTRAADRSPLNPLGTLLDRRGPVTFELPLDVVTLERNEAEMDLANQSFPYTPTTYREF